MSKITYGIIEETYLINGSLRHSYGIAAYSSVGESITPIAIEYANELSSDKQSLQALVDKCNEENLSLVHFYDIVEDFLECRYSK